ncbi:MAG: DMT family protein [Candidatus Nitrotoga sp.]
MFFNILTAHPLLIASDTFTTFAQHGHLKKMTHSPRYVAALVSWSITLFKYLRQVPANRIGCIALCLMGAVFFIFRA